MTEKIKEKFSAYIEQFKPAVFVLPSVIIAAFSVGGFYIGSGSAIKNSAYNNSANNSVEESKNSEDNTESAGDRSAKTKKTVSGSTVKKTVTTVKKTKAKTGKPADGVFDGSSVCEKFGYTVSIKAKFKDGKPVALYGMKMLNNSDNSNDAYMSRAWREMVKRIIGGAADNGTVSDVDSVSGATYSSNAIISAYLDARNKAVAKSEGKKLKATAKPTPVPSKKPTAVKVSKPVKVPSGAIADGKYKVSAVCEPDEDEDFEKYTLSALFTFKNGKCTAISDFSSTAESNKNYYMKAAKGNDKSNDFEEYTLTADVIFNDNRFCGFDNVTLSDEANRFYYNKAVNGTKIKPGIISQINAKQNDELDGVSGATCTSNALIELFSKAWNEAKKRGLE